MTTPKNPGDENPPLLAEYLSKAQRAAAGERVAGSTYNEAVDILCTKVQDGRADQQTAQAIVGVIQEWAGNNAKDSTVLRDMDEARGARAKAAIRQAYVQDLGRALIEQYPFKKVDIEIVPMLQLRLKPLRELRPKVFTYTDGYLGLLLKGLKRGHRNQQT